MILSIHPEPTWIADRSSIAPPAASPPSEPCAPSPPVVLTPRAPAEDAEFVALRERYFLTTLELNPVTCTYLGGDGYSATLAPVNGTAARLQPDGARRRGRVPSVGPGRARGDPGGHPVTPGTHRPRGGPGSGRVHGAPAGRAPVSRAVCGHLCGGTVPWHRLADPGNDRRRERPARHRSGVDAGRGAGRRRPGLRGHRQGEPAGREGGRQHSRPAARGARRHRRRQGQR